MAFNCYENAKYSELAFSFYENAKYSELAFNCYENAKYSELALNCCTRTFFKFREKYVETPAVCKIPCLSL